MARRGRVWPGEEQGEARPGEARPGTAGQGKARQGEEQGRKADSME